MSLRPFQFTSLSRSTSQSDTFFLSRLSQAESAAVVTQLVAAGCVVVAQGCSLGGCRLTRGLAWVAFRPAPGVLFRLASQFPSPDPLDLLVFHPSGRALSPLDLSVLSSRGVTYTQAESFGYLLQGRFSAPPVVRVSPPSPVRRSA